MNKIIMVLCTMSLSASILFAGLIIEKAINNQSEHKIDMAYMKGIAARPLDLPVEIEKGRKYVIFTSTSDATATQIYPPIDQPTPDKPTNSPHE